MALKAIISGGGICGLATAAALAQREWDVTVYESNPGLRVTGSGIYLWSNGLDVLRDIGAYDVIQRDLFWTRGVENRNEKDELVVPAFVPPGLEILCVARSKLLEGLEHAARKSGVKIESSRQVLRARANGSFVLANGDCVSADLAIGCDGASSLVRRTLGLEVHHIRSAEAALRTIVPGTQEEMPEDQRGVGVENWNGTRRMIVSPINGREIFLALTHLEQDAQARDKNIDDSWRKAFPKWAFLLDRIKPQELLWNNYSTVKSDRWSAGNACIVGDAAHAQQPNIGQGGGMAMTNGMGLAAYMATVKDRRDVPEALEAWENTVRPVTEECQRWSSMWGELGTIPNEIRTPLLRAMGSHQWLGSNLLAPGLAKAIIKTTWRPNQAQEASA